MKKLLKSRYSFLLLILFFYGCNNNQVPKPKGYFRIDLPENVQYSIINNSLPYTFEVSDIVELRTLASDSINNWMNVVYPKINATLHLSFKHVKNNLPDLINDAHTFVFKHSVKADAINQNVFYFPENEVAGVLFELRGNAASPYQFFATDSVHNFLRGALYFDTRPNQDSLMPLIHFVEKDIHHLIETLQWK